MCGTDCFLVFLSLLFPPIGVWVKRGLCSADSLINLALCCLGFFPGLLHAWYIIFKYPDAYDYAAVNNENPEGTVTYYYVSQQPARAQRPQQGGYGTLEGSQPNGGQFPGQQSGAPFPAPPKKQQQQGVPQGNGGAGSSSRVGAQGDNPPTYADVIKGDNKVQGP